MLPLVKCTATNEELHDTNLTDKIAQLRAPKRGVTQIQQDGSNAVIRCSCYKLFRQKANNLWALVPD